MKRSSPMLRRCPNTGSTVATPLGIIDGNRSIETRLRECKDLDSAIGVQRDRTDRDFYVRYTQRF